MRILIFSGTTEGRKLSERLSAAGIACDVCVATEYGREVMGDSSNVRVLCGRLDENGMRQLYQDNDYQAVVDATHPYATIVSETIRSSLQGMDIPYYRLSRDVNEADTVMAAHMEGDCIATKDCGDNKEQAEYMSNAATYQTVSECIKALKMSEGNILLTTGSKDLHEFCEDEQIRERIYARVIASVESINICTDNGLKGQQIIAMQGPFSKDLNKAIIEQYHIKHMVTKDSGRTGGLDAKIAAAHETGVKCHVIGRTHTDTADSGMSISRVIDSIMELSSLNSDGKSYADNAMDRTEEVQDKDNNVRLNVVLAGIGCGNPALMTQELKTFIESADYIFGAGRMTEMVKSFASGKILPYYRADDIIPRLEQIYSDYKEANIAILFSGDTGFYSGSRQLYQALKTIDYAEVTIMPGISSVQYMAAKCGISWDDANILSLHGRHKDEWLPKLYGSIKYNSKTLFISSGADDIKTAYDMIMGLSSSIIFYAGRNLSMDDELIYRFVNEAGKSNDNVNDALIGSTYDEAARFEGRIDKLSDSGLYVGLVINLNPDERILSPNLSDDEMIRACVPMTKEDIRKLSVCKLNLTKDSIVYDIGSGTGSVTVEIAGMSDDIRVYAVECNDEAVKLSEENIQKHHRYNAKLVKGMAPEVLMNLPIATHAFIGGSRGNLRDIIDTLMNINPHMRVVMNAVSLESITLMNDIIKDIPVKELDIVQVGISRVKSVGQYNMMNADNPVYIFSFTLNGD